MVITNLLLKRLKSICIGELTFLNAHIFTLKFFKSKLHDCFVIVEVSQIKIVHWFYGEIIHDKYNEAWTIFSVICLTNLIVFTNYFPRILITVATQKPLNKIKQIS